MRAKEKALFGGPVSSDRTSSSQMQPPHQLFCPELFCWNFGKIRGGGVRRKGSAMQKFIFLGTFFPANSDGSYVRERGRWLLLVFGGHFLGQSGRARRRRRKGKRRLQRESRTLRSSRSRRRKMSAPSIRGLGIRAYAWQIWPA